MPPAAGTTGGGGASSVGTSQTAGARQARTHASAARSPNPAELVERPRFEFRERNCGRPVIDSAPRALLNPLRAVRPPAALRAGKCTPMVAPSWTRTASSLPPTLPWRECSPKNTSGLTSFPMMMLEGAPSRPRVNAETDKGVVGLCAPLPGASSPLRSAGRATTPADDLCASVLGRAGTNPGRAIAVMPAVEVGCNTFGSPGRIGSRARNTLGGTAVRQPAVASVQGAPPPTPAAPIGVQPIHPGPEYQSTRAGLHAPNDPGIQNHPISGSKFQNP